MKALKKMSCLVLALCLALGVFIVPTTSAEAASKATVPKKLHISIDTMYNSFTVYYAARGDKIKNLKSSSKNLVAKQTSQCATGANFWPDESITDGNYAYIGLYAKKAGTYKVTFDVYSKKNEKKSSHTVNVKADNSYAVSSITFAGKSIPYSLHTGQKSGKLSVKMAKGYKLKQIYITTYDKNKGQESKTVKVKNKTKITLGQYASNSKYNYTSNDDPDYWRNNWSKAMFAETQIRIEYVDNYTKQTSSAYYYIYRSPKNK